MLQTIRQYGTRALGAIVLTLVSLAGLAQDKVEIDTHEVKSWFETNWIWVVGGIILLLLLVMIGRSGRRNTRTTDNVTGGERKTTTVVKDAAGNVQSVTTTEERL